MHLEKKEKIVSVILIVLIIAGIFYLAYTYTTTTKQVTDQEKSQPANVVGLSLTPASGSYKVDQEFDVKIMVNTGGISIDGVDAILQYDPNVLQVVDKNEKLTGTQIATTELFPIYLGNKVESGTISISGLIQPGTEGFKNNSAQSMAVVTFKVLTAAPSTAVNFDFTPGSKNDSNMAESGDAKEVLAQVGNGSYVIN